jgi:hypothetical protein
MKNYRLEVDGWSPKFTAGMSPAFANLENAIYNLGFTSPKSIRDVEKEEPLKDGSKLLRYQNLKFRYFVSGASEMFINIYSKLIRKNVEGAKVAAGGWYRILGFLHGFDEEKSKQVADAFEQVLEEKVELTQEQF